jgi:hypothetical protein
MLHDVSRVPQTYAPRKGLLPSTQRPGLFLLSQHIVTTHWEKSGNGRFYRKKLIFDQDGEHTILHMRAVILACVIVVGAFWADRTYYSGEYTRHASMMLRDIAHSYR